MKSSLRAMLLMFYYAFAGLFLQAESLNVLNIFEIAMPSELEVLSVKQLLKRHDSSDQYWLQITIEAVYKNSYVPIAINLYGRGDIKRALELTGFSSEMKQYHFQYNLADQLKYLLANYARHSRKNASGIRYSRFISNWPSGTTTDYLGYYLKLPSKVFDECIIDIRNSWSSFNPSGQLKIDEDKFEDRLLLEKDYVQLYYRIIENMIGSISTRVSTNSKYVDITYQFTHYKETSSYYLPKVPNLRLREGPSQQTGIITILANRPYRIIASGPAETINGIAGNWVRIVAIFGNQIGWAFDGFLRKLSDEELGSYFEGI